MKLMHTFNYRMQMLSLVHQTTRNINQKCKKINDIHDQTLSWWAQVLRWRQIIKVILNTHIEINHRDKLGDKLKDKLRDKIQISRIERAKVLIINRLSSQRLRLSLWISGILDGTESSGTIFGTTFRNRYKISRKYLMKIWVRLWVKQTILKMRGVFYHLIAWWI